MYIGPYIQCELTLEEIKKERKYCATDNCKNNKTFMGDNCNFCSLCGQILKIQSYSIKGYKINVMDVIDEIDQCLTYQHINSSLYWIPNIHYDTTTKFPITLNESLGFVNFTSIELNNFQNIKSSMDSEIEKSINDFYTAFEKDIHILTKYYNNISIGFGGLYGVLDE